MGGVSRNKSGHAKKGRVAARRLGHYVRRLKTGAAIIEFWRGDAFVDRPISARGVRAIMEQFPDIVRGDGSRRRAHEVKRGFFEYLRWLEGPPAETFAQYLFSGTDGYPEFDWADINTETLAYLPTRLTVDYKSPTREEANLDVRVFPFSDHGGRSRASLTGAQVDVFAKHRRWQDLIGEKAPNAKLKEPQVVEIRERYAAGGISMAKLAKEYGVTPATVNGIVWGNLWIYAPGPVKCRQLVRARTTQPAVYNRYGERTRTEDHPKPEMLNDAEASELSRVESLREEDRYVSREERRAWVGTRKIEYEWGVFDPATGKATRAASNG